MKNLEQKNNADISTGNVYVMSHSLFSNVIRIGCTPEDPLDYAKSLSATTPGTYTLVYALQCKNPCQVRQQIREYLQAKKYVNEFYEITAEVAEKLVKRETLRIPIVDAL